MNRRDKEKSREIRDIMRTDKWGRMTYKQAHSKWKKGIRAFRVGDNGRWIAFNGGRYGFSREQLRELGRGYFRIAKYAKERHMTLEWEYNSFWNFVVLYASGRTFTGERFGYRQVIDIYDLRHSRCSFEYLANHIIDNMDRELNKYGFYPPKYERLEPILGGLVFRKED